MIVSRPSLSGITRSVITRSRGLAAVGRQRDVAVRGLLDRVARGDERLAQDLADRLVVFDQQDASPQVRSANRPWAAGTCC